MRLDRDNPPRLVPDPPDPEPDPEPEAEPETEAGRGRVRGGETVLSGGRVRLPPTLAGEAMMLGRDSGGGKTSAPLGESDLIGSGFGLAGDRAKTDD